MASFGIAAILLGCLITYSCGARSSITATFNDTMELATLAPACTSEDKTAMIKAGEGNHADSFAGIMAACGSAGVVYGLGLSWSSKKYRTCVQQKLALTDGCVECFSVVGEYGLGNCKKPCFSSWCSKECLKCSEAKAASRDDCIGFAPPIAWACDGSDYGKPIATPAPTSPATLEDAPVAAAPDVSETPTPMTLATLVDTPLGAAPVVSRTMSSATMASATGSELIHALPIGHDVSLYSVAHSRFIRMNNGKIEAGSKKPGTVDIEERERFRVVDAGGGGVALYCQALGRFIAYIAADEGQHLKLGSRLAPSAAAPEQGWTTEPLAVFTTDGSFNMLTIKLKSYIGREKPGNFLGMGSSSPADTKWYVVDHGIVNGGVTAVSPMANGARWSLRRALPIGHDVSLYGAHDRFLRMNKDKIDAGDVKASTGETGPGERFSVVDLEGGLVGLYSRDCGRFVKIGYAGEDEGWTVKPSLDPAQVAIFATEGPSNSVMVRIATPGFSFPSVAAGLEGYGSLISMDSEGSVSAVEELGEDARFLVVDHGISPASDPSGGDELPDDEQADEDRPSFSKVSSTTEANLPEDEQADEHNETVPPSNGTEHSGGHHASAGAGLVIFGLVSGYLLR